jgi:hypothetical protein
MTDGYRKGGKFMNEVCRTFSYWYYPKLSKQAKVYDLPFRQRSTSIMPVEGHWKGEGDILHRPDLPHDFPFCVECKDIEGWSFDGMLTNPGWPVWKWWSQAQSQAATSNRCVGVKGPKVLPLLVFTRNRQPVYGMLSERVADALGSAWPQSAAYMSHFPGESVQQRVYVWNAVRVFELDALTSIHPSRMAALRDLV